LSRNKELRDKALSIDPIAYYESVTGHQLKKSGNHMVGFCPLHNNVKTPAFSIRISSGIFKCYSSGCFGEKGEDIIGFVMLYNNVDYPEALRILTGQSTTNKHKTAIRRPKPKKVESSKDDMFAVGAKMYAKASTTINHAYVTRKKISTGVLQMAGTKQLGNKIITPLVIGTKTIQWQIIYPEKVNGNDKRTYGAMPKVNDTHIGGIIKLGKTVNGLPLLLGEGFATCASAWQATGIPTICAVSSDNMKTIAPIIRKNYPDSVIGLLCDFDISGTGQNTCGHIIENVTDNNIISIMPDMVGDWNDVYIELGEHMTGILIKKGLYNREVEQSPCGQCLPDGMSKVFDGKSLECTNCGRCYNELPAGLNAGQINYSEQVKKAALVHLYG